MQTWFYLASLFWSSYFLLFPNEDLYSGRSRRVWFTQLLKAEGVKTVLFADSRQKQGFSALSLCGKLNVPAHRWSLSGKGIFPTQNVILKRCGEAEPVTNPVSVSRLWNCSYSIQPKALAGQIFAEQLREIHTNFDSRPATNHSCVDSTSVWRSLCLSVVAGFAQSLILEGVKTAISCWLQAGARG